MAELMDFERDFAETVAIGEKNQRTKELICNWCRNARVEKMGGTGLIEIQTGLPIGHHMMACDFAAAGGSACWDLADAALEFHDRNCQGCAHRDPVGLPNLSILIQQRDDERLRSKAQHDSRVAHDNEVRALRRSERRALRQSLDAASAGLVDEIEELDQADLPGERRRQLEHALLEAAKLAPDAFTPPLLEQCFCLLEAREPWFDTIGLELLRQLSAKSDRLVHIALQSLAQHRSIPVSAAILTAHSATADASLIPAALPALVDLAQPEHRPFSHGEEVTDPAPLLALHRTHKSTVEATIAKLLDEHHPYRVNCAVRAILVLTTADRELPMRFARSLAVKLVRAHLLIDARKTGLAGDDEVIHNLQRALASAVVFSPDTVIEMLSHVMEGAPAKGEARVLRAYHLLLDGRFDGADSTAGRAAAKAALRQILTSASTRVEDEIRQEVQSALSHMPETRNWLAAEEATAILGTAILLDDRLQATLDEKPQPLNPLDVLDRESRLIVWSNLQRNLIRWVARAAGDDDAVADQYIAIYQGIDERQQRVRSEMVGRFNRLMNSPSGMARTLPVLYTAMVGSSTMVRSAAAKTIGKLDERLRNDLPRLVDEAFAVLLWDPFVIVHRAAVGALERGFLPDHLRSEAERALEGWIESYAVAHSNDTFLIQAIEIYLKRFGTNAKNRQIVGALALNALTRLPAHEITDKLRWLFHELNRIDGFVEIILKTLEDENVSEYRADDLCALLERLDSTQIEPFKDRLQALAGTTLNIEVAIRVTEMLMRKGAWTQAANAAQTRMEGIPQTAEKLQMRLHACLVHIAARCEEAIASGDRDRFGRWSQEWTAAIRADGAH
jgi:hypothetical protein